MKIVMLRAENIKNLSAVEIVPNGNTVMLTGKNGAGKTAILETIFSTLTGTRLKDPVRHGETRAESEVDMGDYIVRKVWTGDRERIEVTTGAGEKCSSPQTLLNNLIGNIAFDPLEFFAMKPKEQYEIILNMAGIDLQEHDEKRQQLYNDRTIKNREVNRIKGALDSMKRPAPNLPKAPLVAREQVEKIKSLQDQELEYNSATMKKKDLEKRESETKKRIKAIEGQLIRARSELELIEKEIAGITIPGKISVREFAEEQKKLDRINETNEQIEAARKYRSMEKDLKVARDESEDLTIELEKLDATKEKKIQSLKLPIDGLSVGDEQVLFNGVPMERLSRGEQIRVSTAIAMALNPELRVIFCQDASLLDSEGQKAIIEMAKENDYQLWLEQVDESGDVGIYIEDGSIKAIDGEKVEVA